MLVLQGPAPNLDPGLFLQFLTFQGSGWKPTLAMRAVCGAPTPPEQGGWPPHAKLTLCLGLFNHGGGSFPSKIRAVAGQGRETRSVPQLETGPRQVRAPKRL